MHLPRAVYAVIRRLVPIACVDALPYRHSADGVQIGLIRRLDADGKREVWNLVGGRIRHGETLADALERHLRDALGEGANWTIPDLRHPASLDEYFPDERPNALRDPRKHAVAAAYPVPVTGAIRPQGEALGFEWFDVDEIPRENIGYDQARVIDELAAALKMELQTPEKGRAESP